MAEILMTCSKDELEVALDLKAALQLQYGFNVDITVEKDGEDFDEEFDARIEESTVLFVFEIGESRISAWVTIFGVDMQSSNYEQTPFPEAIDFTDHDKGCAVLEDILFTDFGIDVRPNDYFEYSERWANDTPGATIASF